MSETIRVALAGAGAFGIKHLDGLKNIARVEVVSLVSDGIEATRAVADTYAIPHATVPRTASRA